MADLSTNAKSNDDIGTIARASGGDGPKRNRSAELCADVVDSNSRPSKQTHTIDTSENKLSITSDEYTVGWVCALPLEMAAAKGMLDQIHPDLTQQDPADHNNYILGQIQGHNVVIACLPAGIHSTTTAATVAKDLLQTFKSIRFGLLVGIGGGAPSRTNDIRLGDIVVSQPTGTSGGAIQYDRGKTVQDGEFQHTGLLNSPPQVLLTALSRLQTEHMIKDSKIPQYLSELVQEFPKRMRKKFSYQGSSNDCLYQAEYEHTEQDSTYDQCERTHMIQRDARDDTDPVIHYGTIASGNQVIKHGKTRDQLATELGALCFETEAAGLQDFPCLIVRGICDYSDSYKNKKWQEYAAATAAAFAKELLSVVRPNKVLEEKPIQQLVSIAKEHLQVAPDHREVSFQQLSEHKRTDLILKSRPLDPRVVREARYDSAGWNTHRQTLEGHTGLVNAVAFSPDGQVVASASYDKTVRLWDAATGAPRQTLEGHTDWVNAVAFSPDGQVVATASHDETVRLWDAATGAPRQTLEGHTHWVHAVAFSPDGQLVASASYDKMVRLWEAATGAPQQTLEGHTGSVNTVAFSPDGQVVASASDDYTVRLWDAAMGAPRQTLKGHTGFVCAVAFSPDSLVVASASADGTVQLRDTATGAPRQTLEGHSSWVRSVAFSPNGRQLASGSDDSTVKLWDTVTGQCQQTLQGHSSQRLTKPPFEHFKADQFEYEPHYYVPSHFISSAAFSSDEHQQRLLADKFDTNVSSSTSKYKNPAWDQEDKTQLHERTLDPRNTHQESSHTHAGDDSHSASTIACEWELPAVCEDGLEFSAETVEFDVQDFLSGFIILTGDGGGFQCATCLDFVTEQWRNTGRYALRAVSRAVALLLWPESIALSQPEDHRVIRINDDSKLEINSTAHSIAIVMTGPQTVQERRDLAEAILWICTAIRQVPSPLSSHSEHIFKSTVSRIQHDAINASSFHFSLKPLERWSPTMLDDSTCWTALFKSGIVAWRPLNRQWGKGMEMSFEMMVDLATVENYYSLNGGLILLGYKTALTPVAWNKERNSFQWHFEVMEDSTKGFIRPSALKAIQTEWTKLQTPSEFQGARCFVGWFEVAHVMLGTRQLLDQHQLISWSGSDQCRETLRSEGYEGSFQTSLNVTPISLAFQGVKTYNKRSTVRRYVHTDNYRSTLIECKRQVALVIDSATKQAWLVPYLSLILHLCHRYFKNFNTDQTVPNPIPFAQPSSNGHQAALDAMLDQGDTSILGQNLRQLVLRIHLGFTDAARFIEQPKRGSLLATELMSIIEPPLTGTPLSKVKISEPRSVSDSWQDIAKNVDVMGICKDLGQAIKPAFPAGSVCPSCSTLPEGEFYLAAHMHCLDALAVRARGGTIDKIVEGSCPLGDTKTVWQRSSNLWSTCSGQGHASIWETNSQVLQHIASGELKQSAQPRLEAPVAKDGVVVFGDRSRIRSSVKTRVEILGMFSSLHRGS